MIEYTNTIDTFDELYDLCWSGALQRLDEISDLNLEDEFMAYLEDMFIYSYNDKPTLTDINDFIWFEVDDWIEEHKGEEEMIKKEIKDFINNYAKTHNISKKKYSLFPLYIHLDGFSHSIGFTNHIPKKDIIEHNYNSVGYSNYMSNCWGYINNYQEEIATAILSKIPHLIYQNNAKEIIF